MALPVVAYVCSGLFAVSLVQLCLVLCARRLNPEVWGLAYAGLLGAMSALLSLQWMFPLYPSLNIIVLVCLALGGAYSYASMPLRWPRLTSERWLVGLALVLTALELMYAAFPAYRYDQLTYHLQVNKVIARFGTLTGPMFQDHFMTGTYEFIFTLPRALWDDDFFVLSFADAFSCSTFLILWFSLCRFPFFRERFSVGLSLLFALVMACLAPEHEALINAKPDYLFAPIVAMIAVILFLPAGPLNRRSMFLFGSLLVLPLSFKITWLHTLLVVAIPVVLWARSKRFQLPWIVFGVTAAMLPVCVILQKNAFFYGNPLHPMQTSLWPSLFWTKEWDAYWRAVAGKATDLTSYFKILAKTLGQFLRRYAQILWVMTAFDVLALVKRPPRTKQHDMLFLLLGFIVLWPLFFKADIFSRFVASAYGLLGLMLLILVFDTLLVQRRLVLALLVLPILTLSKHEIHVLKMLPALAQTPDVFFATTKDPLRVQSGYFAINRAIKEKTLDPRAVSVFSSDNNGYFLNASLFTVPGNQNLATQEQWLRARGGSGCLFSYMLDQHVYFVFDTDGNVRDWPEPYVKVTSQMQPLPEDPRVYFVEPNKLMELSKNETICQQFKLKI